MARYIDAERLKLQLLDDYTKRLKKGRPFTFNGVETAIDSQPTADVEKARHGEWVADGCMYKCSRCGNMESYYTDSYCRVCGARMEGGAK